MLADALKSLPTLGTQSCAGFARMRFVLSKRTSTVADPTFCPVTSLMPITIGTLPPEPPVPFPTDRVGTC
jgi:hypothetical protein